MAQGYAPELLDEDTNSRPGFEFHDPFWPTHHNSSSDVIDRDTPSEEQECIEGHLTFVSASSLSTCSTKSEHTSVTSLKNTFCVSTFENETTMPLFHALSVNSVLAGCTHTLLPFISTALYSFAVFSLATVPAAT